MDIEAHVVQGVVPVVVLADSKRIGLGLGDHTKLAEACGSSLSGLNIDRLDRCARMDRSKRGLLTFADQFKKRLLAGIPLPVHRIGAGNIGAVAAGARTGVDLEHRPVGDKCFWRRIMQAKGVLPACGNRRERLEQRAPLDHLAFEDRGRLALSHARTEILL